MAVTAVMMWLVSALAAVVAATRHASPFFYLCSFRRPDLDRSANHVQQVALSVSVDGDPSFYVPGQLYNGIHNTVISRYFSAMSAH